MVAVAGDTQLLGDGHSKQPGLLNATYSFATVRTAVGLTPHPREGGTILAKELNQCSMDSTTLKHVPHTISVHVTLPGTGCRGHQLYSGSEYQH